MVAASPERRKTFRRAEKTGGRVSELTWISALLCARPQSAIAQ